MICDYCHRLHEVLPLRTGGRLLPLVGMPGWHRFSDGLIRNMKWIAPHEFTVIGIVANRADIPREPETEMDRWFRAHPEASTD